MNHILKKGNANTCVRGVGGYQDLGLLSIGRDFLDTVNHPTETLSIPMLYRLAFMTCRLKF